MRLGIDLGGSKIEIAALESDGTLSVRERVPVPAGDYHGTIRALAGLVEGIEARRGHGAPSGLGFPAPSVPKPVW